MKVVLFHQLIIVILKLDFVSAQPIEKKVAEQTIGSDSVIKIGNEAPHCAFTDLIRFNNSCYCSFGEASSHVRGTDGKSESSNQGMVWKGQA
ncbi:MAG: hypothetical protein WDZ72_14085 [Cyclobacteriaceae bacterium]